jgi:hypothetical protein
MQKLCKEGEVVVVYLFTSFMVYQFDRENDSEETITLYYLF